MLAQQVNIRRRKGSKRIKWQDYMPQWPGGKLVKSRKRYPSAAHLQAKLFAYAGLRAGTIRQGFGT